MPADKAPSAPKITAENVETGDYVANLAKNESLWLTVGNASLYIKRTDEGVVVDIYGKGREDGESVASTYAFDAELEEDSQEDAERAEAGA